MLTENRLVKKIQLTYDQWQDWLYENTPDSWDVDSTIELLAYFGYVNYMVCKENMPQLDLKKLDTIIFGSEEESNALIEQFNPKKN
jgi:hypothetical protein